MKYVYIVRVGDNNYKVGVANNVSSRVKELQTGNAGKIEIVCSALVDNEYVIERSLHELMSEHRAMGGKEWFELEPQQVIDLCVTLNSFPGASVADFAIERLKTHINGVISGYGEQTRTARNGLGVMTSGMLTSTGDELLIERARVIFDQAGRVSTSLLQRKLRIGYGRAARIVDTITTASTEAEMDPFPSEL